MGISVDLESLDIRLKTFQSLESDRSKWCQEILDSLKLIKKDHDEIQADLQSEREARRGWQAKSKQAEEELHTLRRANNQSSFAVVLIDGDGAVFEDALLKRPDGGKIAARQLLEEIKKYLHTLCGHETPVSAIKLFMYLNIEGLARALREHEIIAHTDQLYDFMRQLCMEKLFNVVDVGMGKERADYKMKEMFEFYYKESHCKHIIFGGCHDNGYVPLLDRCSGEDESRARITLLETTPLQRGYQQLAFNSTTLNVFRSTELTFRSSHAIPPLIPEFSNGGGHTEAGQLRSATPTSSKVNGLDTAEGANELQRGTSSQVPYAAVTSKPTESMELQNKKANHGLYMGLDAKKDRVDIPIPEPSRVITAQLEDIIKTHKLCNDHYLTGYCIRGEECPFTHSRKLSSEVLLALRRKARALPCTKGKYCRFFDCVKGHNCPYTGDYHPRGECFFKERCSLKIDFKPRYKLYEDGHMVLC